MQATNTYPSTLNRPIGDDISFDVEAVDRDGFITWSSEHPSMPFRQTHFSCVGDDCACCLLLTSQTSDCAQRPGLIGIPGSGFENGFCMTF